ncbi:sugar ABC transporter permease [Streptomyces armeniacus]|uniref:Sugar ABC transporter permease n=1 Tax=Streptomyces armeniacus TaxID=83291 RepID=A0A345XTN6_9ACTN|nr:sugar ABC transporter permease [Streptomyces armeniacus]AXK35002.1 sugar ABC transporter permease [Streptomyces armeniacus]
MVRRLGAARRRETLLRLACLAPAAVLLLTLVAWPVLNVCWRSLTHSSLIHPEPRFVGLANFTEAFDSPSFRTVLGNTAVWTLAVVALQFLLGMAAAVLLSRRFHGRGLLRALLVVPWVMPGIVAGLIWKMLEDPYVGPVNALLGAVGLVDGNPAWLGQESTSLLGVIVAATWKGFPISAVMYLAAYQAVPEEQREAARVDGARGWQVFWHVTLPGMAPTIITTVLLTTVWTFNSFDMIYVMTKGGPGVSSEVLSSYIYRTAFLDVDHGSASAYGVVSVAVLAVFSVLYLRQVRRVGELR